MLFTSKIQKAIRRASLLHEGQKRKCDGSPYVTHLFGVALILAHYVDDEDVIVAGILHDVLEDVPKERYSDEDMRQEFGAKIYAIVKEVTEDKDPEEHRTKSQELWLKRKQQYIDNLKNDSQEALLVAAADKIHNLLSMIESHEKYGDEIWQHFKAPENKRMWFYREVFAVLASRLAHPIIQELAGVLALAESRFEVE